MTRTLLFDLRNDLKSLEVRWLTLLGTVLQAGSGAGGGAGSLGLSKRNIVVMKGKRRHTFYM